MKDIAYQALLMYLTCLFLIGGGKDVLAQSSSSWKEAGELAMRYIDPSVYNASKENWAITEDEQGLLYVANSIGLLIHDGVTWELVEIPTGIIRSMAMEPDGRLFIGSMGDLGYLKQDSLGNQQFVSLKGNISTTNHDFLDIWYTVATASGVYFLSDKYLFRWADGNMYTLESDTSFLSMAALNDQVFVLDKNDTIHVIEENSLRPTTGALDITTPLRLTAEDDSHLLVHSRKALSRCMADVLGELNCTSLVSNIDELIKGANIYSATHLSDGTLVIGFDGEGLALLSAEGKLLRHLGEEDGLMNLEVMGIYRDRQDALWLALYDGLARLDPSPAWSSFGREEGIPSAVSRIARHGEKTFAATTLGLFELEHGKGAARFRKVPDSDNFINCWDFIEVDKILYAGCSNGLIRIEKPEQPAEITHINDLSSLDLAPDPHDSSIFYVAGAGNITKVQATKKGVEIIHEESMPYVFFSVFAERPNDNMTRLWAVSHTGAAFKINIPDDDTPWTTMPVDSSMGLDASVSKFFGLAGNLHAATDAGLFRLSEGERFVHNPIFADGDIFPLGRDNAGKLWVTAEDSLFILNNDGASKERILDDRLALIRDPMALDTDSTSTLWLSHGRGVIRYEPPSTAAISPSVQLRAVKRTRDGSFLYHAGVHVSNTVSYDQASLTFEFAAQVYDVPEGIRYRIWLEGLDLSWEPWTPETKKEYTNLKEGDYTFRLQAKTASGRISSEVLYNFTVHPPWYRTGWAYLVWILLTGSILASVALSYNHVHTRRLQARNKILERRVNERTEKIRSQKAVIEQAYEELQWINEELTRSNQGLEERSDQLRNALEVNKEILGITAHDLKNPLSGIIGLTDMVLFDANEGLEATSKSVKENLPILKAEAERMLQIVINLLDSHRQGENVALKKEKVKLGDIVSTALRWNKQQAEKKNITLHYDGEENIFVEVDVMAIQRVLDNYISNAIKYSKSGTTVWVETKKEPGSDGHSWVRTSVRDEGPGLTENDKKKVFGKLQQLSAKPTGGEHSTGLGLFIVKKLTEEHGGKVGVESNDGQGATFWFTLKTVLAEEFSKLG